MEINNFHNISLLIYGRGHDGHGNHSSMEFE